MQPTLLAFLILLAKCHSVCAQNCSLFVYPAAAWPSTCSACNGAMQSPIDLKPSTAQAPPGSQSAWFANLTLSPNVSWTSVNFSLTNSGDSILLNFHNLQVRVTGLGLNGTFLASHIHWHWGSNASVGSEHTLNGNAFVMEGHLVCYNAIYPSLGAALGKPNGVAVFAVWYQQASTADNPLFTPINYAVLSIPYNGDTTYMSGFSLFNLMPNSFFPYFRYSGSLTIPGCQQNITWTVLNNYYTISVNQMNMIRYSMFYKTFLSQSYNPMVDNFRETQPLNNRVVYYVAVNGGKSTHNLSSLIVLTCAAALLSVSCRLDLFGTVLSLCHIIYK